MSSKIGNRDYDYWLILILEVSIRCDYEEANVLLIESATKFSKV